MAGISSFFKSDNFSDTKLVFLLTSVKQSSTAAPQAHTSSITPTTADEGPSSCGTKRKADTPADTEGDGDSVEDEGTAVCIPAQRLILMAKSTYFSTCLSTAVGSTTTSVIREHAACMEEIHAMEAVVEFMYTEKLPLLSHSGAVQPAGVGGVGMSDLQKLLLRLTVADRWQVPSCLVACCTAICAQPTTGMTWDDCSDLYNLPQAVRDQPQLSQLVDYTATIAVNLANVITTAPNSHLACLCAQFEKLPVPVRLAMLEGCQLGFLGMLVLLIDDEAVADSEDSLALILSRYMKSPAGRACSAFDLKKLKDQLRYQHMSNAFIGLELPGIPDISLDKQQLSQMLYLRSLTGFDYLPEESRIPSIPPAWYQPARERAVPLPNSVELTFNLPREVLAEYVKAVALFRSGGPEPDHKSSEDISFRGTKWSLSLESTSDSMFMLAVTPSFKSTDSSSTTCVYVKTSFCLNSASPTIKSVDNDSPDWVSDNGMGIDNFVQVNGKRSGDPLECAWWEDCITDGHVRFSATVTYV